MHNQTEKSKESMVNIRLSMVGAALMLAMSVMAGEKLRLFDISRGDFRQETLSEVRPMADGETYAQISSDVLQTSSPSPRPEPPGCFP